jgi:hypothetical protein
MLVFSMEIQTSTQYRKFNIKVRFLINTVLTVIFLTLELQYWKLRSEMPSADPDPGKNRQ